MNVKFLLSKSAKNINDKNKGLQASMMFVYFANVTITQYEKMIVANWKANGNLSFCYQVMNEIAALKNIKTEIIICPPHPYLHLFHSLTGSLKISLGAQDCSIYDNGSYTGEVTCNMLHDMKCKYMIVGHSERRVKENHDIILHKLKEGRKWKIKNIFCIGEPLIIREQGQSAILNYLTEQLKEAVPYCDIIAYEPIWSIGSGLIASYQELNYIVTYLQKITNLPILYGGSINKNNIKNMLGNLAIDGCLVGKASLNISEFLFLINTLDRTKDQI